MKRRVTGVSTIRFRHEDVAVIADFYASQNYTPQTLAALIASAVEDFAEVIRSSGEVQPYDLESAIERVSSFRGQSVHANKLHRTRALELMKSRESEIYSPENIMSPLDYAKIAHNVGKDVAETEQRETSEEDIKKILAAVPETESSKIIGATPDAND